MRFVLLDGLYAVARLEADADTPPWAHRGAFTTITRTPHELSIVCDEGGVPDDVAAERGWRCLGIEGTIPFATTGVAARFTAALAARGISVFVVSTFDTDYVLVKAAKVEAAVEALRDAGYDVSA
ncbi:MAG TPA: ACT domain-containing protein [Thermoanaerobaculia bacterium]|nr:ACT domain-containing protein [Thermoanaerobaculia bacterium]